MERIEDFQVLNQIGRGGFASVYRAVCRADGKVSFKIIIATLNEGSVLVYDFWTPPPPIKFVHGS